MKIRVKKSVLREIERKTKQSYPLEVFGYLVGDTEQITKVLWPRQVRDDASCAVFPGEYNKLRRQHTIIGSVHSHPKEDYPFPSAADHLDECDRVCFAVISVFKEGDKKLKTRMMFFEPLKEVEVIPFNRSWRRTKKR